MNAFRGHLGRSLGAKREGLQLPACSSRIGWLLEKRGLIERDAEYGWLSGDPVQAGSLDEWIGWR